MASRSGPRSDSQTSPTGSRCSPDRWQSIRRSVTSPCAGTVRWASSRSSRSSRPSSRACSTSAAVNVLVIDPIRYWTSGPGLEQPGRPCVRRGRPCPPRRPAAPGRGGRTRTTTDGARQSRCACETLCRNDSARSSGSGRGSRRGRHQPGGQVRSRPPSTCPCTWKTLWWACATAVEDEPELARRSRPRRPWRPAGPRPPARPGRRAPARRRRRSARVGPPARAAAPAGRGRGRRAPGRPGPPRRPGSRRRRCGRTGTPGHVDGMGCSPGRDYRCPGRSTIPLGSAQGSPRGAEGDREVAGRVGPPAQRVQPGGGELAAHARTGGTWPTPRCASARRPRSRRCRSSAPHRDRLAPGRAQVHLDPLVGLVPPGHVLERVEVEVGVELAVDHLQHVLVELRRDPGRCRRTPRPAGLASLTRSVPSRNASPGRRPGADGGQEPGPRAAARGCRWWSRGSHQPATGDREPVQVALEVASHRLHLGARVLARPRRHRPAAGSRRRRRTARSAPAGRPRRRRPAAGGSSPTCRCRARPACRRPRRRTISAARSRSTARSAFVG